jgi:hypothetical protein
MDNNSMTVKEYGLFVKEELERPKINLYNITNKYYNLLQNSENESELNDKIVEELTSIMNFKKEERDKLCDIFNKSSTMDKAEFQKNMAHLSTSIIGAVKNRNSDEIFDISIQESKSIIQKEIMDWEYFKTNFDRNFEYWQIKEAMGWVAGYIETEDYDPKKTLVMKQGVLDKKQTLKNILNDINKKSLTDAQPFMTSGKDLIDENGNLNFQFRGARSGEVDVMLWSEKKQKSIALSVTRDRSVQIEGNQFLRHYMKMLSLTLKIKNKHSDNNEIKQVAARNYMKSDEFKETRRLPIHLFKNLTRQAKNEISQNLGKQENGRIKMVHNDFFKDLVYVREELSKNNKNYSSMKNLSSLDISSDEIKDIIELGKKHVDYKYFGELMEKDEFTNELNASLNSFAYITNYNSLGNVNLGYNNAFEFLKTIDFKYNKVFRGNQIEKGLENTLLLMTLEDQQFKLISDNYSEGHSYNEERLNVLKSIQSVFHLIKEDCNKKELLMSYGMEERLVDNFLTKLESEDFLSNLDKKLNTIKYSQSELSNDKDNTMILVENFIMKEKQKTIAEFLDIKNMSIGDLRKLKESQLKI